MIQAAHWSLCEMDRITVPCRVTMLSNQAMRWHTLWKGSTPGSSLPFYPTMGPACWAAAWRVVGRFLFKAGLWTFHWKVLAVLGRHVSAHLLHLWLTADKWGERKLSATGSARSALGAALLHACGWCGGLQAHWGPSPVPERASQVLGFIRSQMMPDRGCLYVFKTCYQFLCP